MSATTGNTVPAQAPALELDADLAALLQAAQADLGSSATLVDRIAVRQLQAQLLSTQASREYARQIAADTAAARERDAERDARYQEQYASSLAINDERDARYQAQYATALDLVAARRLEDMARAEAWREQDIARQAAHNAAMLAAAEAQLEILRSIPQEPGESEPPSAPAGRAVLVRELIATMAPAYMKPGTGTTEATQAADARNDAQYLRLAITEVLAVHDQLLAAGEPR